MHKPSAFVSLSLSSATLLAALLMTSSPAHAEDRDRDGRDDRSLTIALDLDYVTSIDSQDVDQGGGGALRIGSELDLFLVTLIPEVSLDLHNLGTDRDPLNVFTGKLGGRIRFLEIVEPGIFAHLGIGHIGGDARWSHTGVAFDAGVTVDLTILPLIDLGLHASWNRIFGGYDSGLSYGLAGAHAALVF
jgi:hypothetical protein